MTGDRLSLATRVMRARKQTTCPACRRLIIVGDQIARLVSPQQWIHIGCTPVVAAALAAGHHMQSGEAANEGKRP